MVVAIILISVVGWFISGFSINVQMCYHAPDIIESKDAFEVQTSFCIRCFQLLYHTLQTVWRFSKGYSMLIVDSYFLFYHV